MSLFHAALQPALDTNGDPISGARWRFTLTGTTTNAAVYADDELNTSLGPYVDSNAAGRFAVIFLDDAVSYRARLWPDSTETGTPIKDIDPANGSAASGVIGLFSAASGVTTEDDRLRTSGYNTAGLGGADYIYDAAVDAAYVLANPRVSFVSANARGFRLDPNQPLVIQMFGGKADGGYTAAGVGPRTGTVGATDNALALAAALAYVQAIRITSGSNLIYRASPEITFPAADGVYDFASTVEVRTTVRLRGHGSGTISSSASVLRWQPGMHGMIFHDADTALAGTVSPSAYSASGFIVEGLAFIQHSTGNNWLADDYHAIWQRVRGVIRDCFIGYWSGDGIHVDATEGGGGLNEGNANNSAWERLGLYGNQNGIKVTGGDTNAGLGPLIDAQYNRAYGLDDNSFLGNTWPGPHTDQNGLTGSFQAGGQSSVASYLGNFYYVRDGQAVGASTNAPSGTTADNTWWGYLAASPGGVVPWSSGLTWVQGGAYRANQSFNTRALFLGPYSEASNGASMVSYPAQLIGGLLAGALKGTGGLRLDNGVSGATLSVPLDVTTALRVNGSQVVGARLTALPADATDLATAITLVNAIKARMKVTGGHGLVAD